MPISLSGDGTVPWPSWLEASEADLTEFLTTQLWEAQKRLDRLKADESLRLLHKFLPALDDVTADLDAAFGCLRHLASVAKYPQFRRVEDAVATAISDFYTHLGTDKHLYTVLSDLARSEMAHSLSGEWSFYLRQALKGLSDAGANLFAEETIELADLNLELNQMCGEFQRNVDRSNASFHLPISHRERLRGISDEEIQQYARAAEHKGLSHWVIDFYSTHYPTALNYAEDAGVREALYRAYGARAADTNGKLIPLILKHRRELARLVGYSNFADRTLSSRMAKTASRAAAFLEQMAASIRPTFIRENERLEKYAEKRLQPWDVSFYAARLSDSSYAYPSEGLHAYCTLDNVLAAVIEVAQRLFGVSISVTPSAPTYDDVLRHYRMQDDRGNLLAGCYLDLLESYPKRGGSWMDALICVCKRSAVPGVSVLCSSFQDRNRETCLLTPRQVETVFFLFGFFLQEALSAVESRSLTCTSFPWDFVHFVPQVMERLCWEPEIVALYARHWKTNQPLDTYFIEQMKRAQTFRWANSDMRQLGFATMDLDLHTRFDPATHGSVIPYCRDIMQLFSPCSLPEGYAMIASFTHLFSNSVGYGGGYYGYTWSQVLAAAAVRMFRREGVLNRGVGLRFHETILSKAASRDPAESFANFTGTPLDMERLIDEYVAEQLADGQRLP